MRAALRRTDRLYNRASRWRGACSPCFSARDRRPYTLGLSVGQHLTPEVILDIAVPQASLLSRGYCRGRPGRAEKAPIARDAAAEIFRLMMMWATSRLLVRQGACL